MTIDVGGYRLVSAVSADVIAVRFVFIGEDEHADRFAFDASGCLTDSTGAECTFDG